MIVEPRHSRLVTPEEIKNLMEVCFAAGQPCPVVITGSSMTPFLVPGRDRVFLRPAPPALRRGDIAFYERAPGRLVLHRVYRASPQGYYFVGDAQTAIDVGKVFDTEKSIINYENLGIGRLIYQLPTTLCEIFLSEVFKKNSIDSLDQETLFTINKFFENNLNVSETSRKLFVHRNTLVYRLEKIKKLTGLDLRQFDHAIVFKVALMVRKYLTSRENR